MSSSLAEVHDIFQGAYSADRAAALSGVPRSTLYYWARHDVWEPSLRATRPRLWTYADVLALRMIHWLRHPKVDSAGVAIPSSTMREVRSNLTIIRAQADDIWAGRTRVLVDRSGEVVFRAGDAAWKKQQAVFGDLLDLLSEFRWSEGLIGPDLIKPRATLRIIPGKLSGEPHVERTRIGTRGIATLIDDGLEVRSVLKLYPALSEASVVDAVDLEKQLQTNAA